ncbi:MAG: DUF86 domain-containing protein [Candidatus Micrarchaeia archaeon]
MMDKERIAKRLTDIERYSGVLGSIVPSSYDAYKKSGITTKAAVERYLQLISDLELEVLVLAYRGLDLGIAGGEDSLISKFSGLLSKGAIEDFKARRTLRNMLVHAYFDMHYDKEVYGQASNRSGILKFIKEINKIVGGAP